LRVDGSNHGIRNWMCEKRRLKISEKIPELLKKKFK
jgi:hypothetical protein